MITIGCLVDMWHTYTELGVAFTEALNLAQCPWPALPPVFWPGFWSTVMSSATCSQIYRGCWFQDVETNNMTCEFQPAHVNKVHVPKQQNQILKQQKVGKWNKHRFRKAKGGKSTFKQDRADGASLVHVYLWIFVYICAMLVSWPARTWLIVLWAACPLSPSPMDLGLLLSTQQEDKGIEIEESTNFDRFMSWH